MNAWSQQLAIWGLLALQACAQTLPIDAPGSSPTGGSASVAHDRVVRSEPGSVAPQHDAGVVMPAADGGSVTRLPDGVPVDDLPACQDNEWQLAPGFKLARHVDFVADVGLWYPKDDAGAGKNPPAHMYVASSAGEPCGDAREREQCDETLTQETLRLPDANYQRKLVTTTGAKVETWLPERARELFGTIDTSAEALWMLVHAYFHPIPCGANVLVSDEGFTVQGIPNTYCQRGSQGTYSVALTHDGRVIGVIYDSCAR